MSRGCWIPGQGIRRGPRLPKIGLCAGDDVCSTPMRCGEPTAAGKPRLLRLMPEADFLVLSRASRERESRI